VRFTSLSSGSEGNALVVESTTRQTDPTRILIDCGLGLREICRRLELRGLAPTDLDAIFVTHEHGDHVGGVSKLARHAELSVLCSHGTRLACAEDFWAGVQVTEVESHASLTVGAFTLHCFPVPHDSREPVQLVVQDGDRRLGVLTDLGRSTPHIESMLSGVDALFLEANHDEVMLANSDYPTTLKTRIGGPFGHLSNAASAALLSALDQSRLQHVVAAHLSRHNNTPDLARNALMPVLHQDATLHVASQSEGFDWVELV